MRLFTGIVSGLIKKGLIERQIPDGARSMLGVILCMTVVLGILPYWNHSMVWEWVAPAFEEILLRIASNDPELTHFLFVDVRVHVMAT